MSAKPSFSVVMPTYNCAPLMARHLESVAKWADLVDEIIVVDSRSTDGTLDIIREGLRHPNLRVIERDRGLYESWNEGIAATSGKWIYISTAGDTIERAHLLHLQDFGERGQADVVISSPRFVDEAGAACDDLDWPPSAVIDLSGRRTPFLLTAEAGFVLTFLHCPNALLGSSASNLYRGAHLRARPFPVEFKGAGDSVWILRHAAQSRICLTPKIGSTFCVHPKEEEICGVHLAELVKKIEVEKREVLSREGLADPFRQALDDASRVEEEVKVIHSERRRLWHAGPLTPSNLYEWLNLTMTYLQKRRDRNIRRRRILKGVYLTDDAYLTV